MQSIHAKYLFPVSSPPILDCYVSYDDGVIQSISKTKPDGEIQRIDGPVVPGLVNAHTHLEFSDLSEPIGKRKSPFVDWVRLVIEHRKTRNTSELHKNIKAGIAESAKQGVAAIGEISTFDWTDDVPTESIHVVDFRELIGFTDSQVTDQNAIAEKHLGKSNSITNFGLSPHAPYSVNHSTIDCAIDLSNRSSTPIAMHLAESEEELELLRNHSGPFFDLLNSIGIWQPDNFAKGTRPIHFLQQLSRSAKALIIHGNYLSQSEIEFISDARSKLHLVYCPRTHHFFDHDPYPIDSILNLGIPLAIGTDSRASNPDLSIWNEMEFLANHTTTSPQKILEMGTLNGAMALGLQKQLGSIEVGKSAKFHFPSLKYNKSNPGNLASALTKSI